MPIIFASPLESPSQFWGAVYPPAYPSSILTLDFDLTTVPATHLHRSVVSRYMRIDWKTTGRYVHRALQRDRVRARVERQRFLGAANFVSPHCNTSWMIRPNSQSSALVASSLISFKMGGPSKARSSFIYRPDISSNHGCLSTNQPS